MYLPRGGLLLSGVALTGIGTLLTQAECMLYISSGLYTKSLCMYDKCTVVIVLFTRGPYCMFEGLYLLVGNPTMFGVKTGSMPAFLSTCPVHVSSDAFVGTHGVSLSAISLSHDFLFKK